MVDKVKLTPGTESPSGRRRGFTRLSSKNQATIPVTVVAASGLHTGEPLKVSSPAPGQVLLERAQDPFEAALGSLPGVFEPGYLGGLRQEWARQSSTPAS